MEKKIIYVGSASSQGSQGGGTYKPQGVMPTICANTHGYAIGNVLRKWNRNEEVNHGRSSR